MVIESGDYFLINIFTSTWFIIGAFSVWGGVVRYLIDTNLEDRNYKAMFSQVIISSFTGFLGGFYGYEHQWSSVMTLIISGICSTFGGSLLIWIWHRVFQHS